MDIESPAFENGGMIPDKYGYTEENISPPLEFSDVPEEAETIVVIMDDPDAKPVAGKVWDHWVVWNLPANIRMIDGGYLPDEASEGRNDFGGVGYGGPNPPDKTHEYRLRAYALEKELGISKEATKDEVVKAMEGHVIEHAEMTGRYSPN